MLYGILRSVSSKLPWDFMHKIDPFRRIPICIAYTWGLLCMPFFGLWPIVEGRENLELLREADENGKKGLVFSVGCWQTQYSFCFASATLTITFCISH